MSSAPHGPGEPSPPGAVRNLLLAAGSFAAWIAYLAYLVVSTYTWRPFHRPIILSRPQFLLSRLDVIADVSEAAGRPEATVQIREVVRSQGGKAPGVGPALRIANLPEAEGWQGPGAYILPLVPDGRGGYLVAATPALGIDLRGQGGPPRIYPLTPGTRRQLESLPKLD
ncbi:MAG: hypothetical protein NZ700_04490 [Gemmataceae bacterium]|nr:hypothetical protein [Gemmataceae bacterium]MDW8266479.1 hypothetical protein [Gemmataceae bacterium]